MSQSELQVSVKQLEQVASEVVSKIRELGLDGKLKEETERLINIVNDIIDWMGRVPRFTVRPSLLYPIDRLEDAEVEFIVQGFEIREYVSVSGRFGEVKAIDVYRKFFERNDVLSTLLYRYVETLTSIAVIVRENYNLVEKLKQIEDRLWELERSDH